MSDFMVCTGFSIEAECLSTVRGLLGYGDFSVKVDCLTTVRETE
jgi:hypothetical protein